jgi:hypothetical protein
MPSGIDHEPCPHAGHDSPGLADDGSADYSPADDGSADYSPADDSPAAAAPADHSPAAAAPADHGSADDGRPGHVLTAIRRVPVNAVSYPQQGTRTKEMRPS